MTIEYPPENPIVAAEASVRGEGFAFGRLVRIGSLVRLTPTRVLIERTDTRADPPQQMAETCVATSPSRRPPSSVRRTSSADAPESDPAAVRTAVARSTSIRFSAHDDDEYSSSDESGGRPVDDGMRGSFLNGHMPQAGPAGGDLPGVSSGSSAVISPGSDVPTDASLCRWA